MSKHTTTIMEIIQSELINRGLNEFVNNDRLSFNNKEFAFIQKVMYYDEDVQNVVNDVIFKGFKFNDERIDRYFKEAFITKFSDREIGRQTVEAFAMLVLHETIIREDYIYTVFGSELYKYLEQHVDSESEDTNNANENETQQSQSKRRQQDKQNEEHEDERHSDGTSTSDDRELTSSLPQSEINLDVDNDVLLYGDTNTISKNKTNTTDDETSRGTRDSDLDSLTNGNEDSKRNNQQESVGNHNSLTKSYFMDNLDKLYDMRERVFKDYDKKCFLHIW